MSRAAPFQDLPLGSRPAGCPVHRWLFEEIRGAILTGRLRPGARLPSSRSLAAQQRIARATVVEAFDQLRAEGYITSRAGSGTQVSRDLPEKFVRVTLAPPKPRGRSVPTGPDAAALPPLFAPCRPGADQFPVRLWAQLMARRFRVGGARLLEEGDPRGYAPLRVAIADYLGSSRSVRCEPEQVVIVSGTQQALDLVARLTLSAGRVAWLENPGYLGARSALTAAGAEILPVRVDDRGMDVAHALERGREPGLVYVTPAHQFPLGGALSLERRLILLEAARRTPFWIFEDDYDGEYRYDSRPLGSLQGQDRHGRVIYSGSFNKLLFPALRLGYVVLPLQLVDPFLKLREAADRFPPTVQQAVLADFFQEGHFARHIRRSRTIYLERRDAVRAAVQRRLGELVQLLPCEAGFQLVGLLADDFSDHEIEEAAARENLAVAPLSRHYLGRSKQGLLIGFSGVKRRGADAAVERLARVIRSLGPSR